MLAVSGTPDAWGSMDTVVCAVSPLHTGGSAVLVVNTHIRHALCR